MVTTEDMPGMLATELSAHYMCLLLLPLIMALTFEGSLRWGWVGDELATHEDANVASPCQFRNIKAAV